MEHGLRASLIRHVPSTAGNQADIALIEPNGDEHKVRCLIRSNGTEIGGDEADLHYLNEKYGDQEVCLAAQDAVLGICDHDFNGLR